MAQRPPAPKITKLFEFDTKEECEESDPLPSGAHHRVIVKVWPPPRSREGEHNPSLRVRCTRCNCHATLYGNNNPIQSDWDVVLEKPPAEKGGDLHAAQGSKGRV